ncbi:MAG: D-alanyl-D-alanine carboxypeptidase, partial [Desulfofustis sp.]
MRWSRPTVTSAVLALWAFFCATGDAVAQQRTSIDTAALDHLITNGGYRLTKGRKTLARYNDDTLFIPASTIKIATALAAFEIIGPDQRFKTEFYLRRDTTLCIKGYGDPYLISERIEDIAAALRNKGVNRVEKIIIDDSYFSLDGPADGSENSENPYDAYNRGLSVNFNSISLTRHSDGSVTSAENQTPTLPITIEIGSLIGAGSQRVNVSAYTARNQTITPLRYAAELFAQLLRNHGVVVAQAYERGRIDRQDRLLYTYYSEK